MVIADVGPLLIIKPTLNYCKSNLNVFYVFCTTYFVFNSLSLTLYLQISVLNGISIALYFLVDPFLVLHCSYMSSYMFCIMSSWAC